MIFGLGLILAGILILVFPQLLSFIVALFLIFLGTIMVSLTIHYRRTARRIEDPFWEFFFRF